MGNRQSAIGNPGAAAGRGEGPRYQQLDAWQLTDDLCQRASRVLYGLMRSVSATAKADGNARRYLKEEAAAYGPAGFASDE